MKGPTVILHIAYQDADTIELVVDGYRRQSVVYRAASSHDYLEMMAIIMECAKLLISYDYGYAVETTEELSSMRKALQSYYARNRSLVQSHTVRVWGDRK